MNESPQAPLDPPSSILDPPPAPDSSLDAPSSILHPRSSSGSALTSGAISTWRLVIALALPVLAQQSLSFVVMQSDQYLAGHLRGMEVGVSTGSFQVLSGPLPAAQMALSQVALQTAATTGRYLAWVIVCYTILVTVGSTALVARFVGASDHPLAIRVTHQALVLAIALGLFGSAWALGGGIDWLVEILQLHGDAADLTRRYLQPLFLLLIFQMIEAAGIACLIGAGDTRTGMWVMLGVALVNLPLAWGFAQGWWPLPRLGFVGIAMGTALSHLLGALVVLTVLARGRFGLRLHVHLFAPNWNLLRRLLRVGVPAGLDSMSVVAGQLWFLSIVNGLGDVAAGAHGIALGWEALGYLSGAAFGTAAMTLVGQNLGAGKPQRASHGGWVAFGLGGAVMSFMGAVFFLLAQPMFRFFCPYESQAGVIQAGVPVLRLVAFAMPALASSIIFTQALRGAGDTRVPLLFTWTGFFAVRIPLAYFLALGEVSLPWLGIESLPGAGLGLYGAWLAMFADITVRGIFFFLRFTRGGWQRIKV
jgi:putative MATE family efflux protein